MKKCQRCTKPASLHITEIQDGVVQELHLCESCAHQYLHNPTPPTQNDPDEELAAQLSEMTSDEDLEELDQLTCPNCGMTWKEFRRRHRLGCPHDYIAFERELLPLLDNIHGDTEHRGKFPKRAPDSSRRQYELIKLRNQLRVAVEDENYEEAASLRDRIQKLEKEFRQEVSE